VRDRVARQAKSGLAIVQFRDQEGSLPSTHNWPAGSYGLRTAAIQPGRAAAGAGGRTAGRQQFSGQT
jgi:hypothetical protein